MGNQHPSLAGCLVETLPACGYNRNPPSLWVGTNLVPKLWYLTFSNHVNTFRVLYGSLRMHMNRGGPVYTHLWLRVVPCGSTRLWRPLMGRRSFVCLFGLPVSTCGYLRPSALTMPVNYNTVSWDLKYVQTSLS